MSGQWRDNVSGLTNSIFIITVGASGIGLVALAVLHSRGRTWLGAIVLVFTATILSTGAVRADGSGDATAVREEDGKYFDKKGDPTYKIQPDGTVDWYTYSGFVRYNAECIRCHGPDGSGSSYGPALTDSLKTMSYTDFLGVVASGRKVVNTASDLVMPAFGTDKNVMCVIDDIFVYLRARSDGALGRGRPAKHEPEPAAAKKWEDTCFGPN
jgi:methanol metabolism-related c-type cytochrome